jgi:nucleotide-binding universal stress UspA family protein
MQKVLVASDGSDNAHRVVDYVIKQAARSREPVEVHLLNVQLPLTGVHVKMFIDAEELSAYYREEGTQALQQACERFAAAGIQYARHIGVGHPAEVIVQHAEDQHCEQIVMGTRGLGTVSNLVLGSIATKVIHLAQVPVVLVK